MDSLERFAKAHAIGYPLLADPDSRVIRALGMWNTELEASAAARKLPHPERYRGVSYPGVFLLDEDGIVVARRSYEDDHVRDTGAGLLEDLLGAAAPHPGPAVEDGLDAVRIRAGLDSPTFTQFQRMQLLVDIEIGSGFHIYGDPPPEGALAVGIEVEPIPTVTSEPAILPPPGRVAGHAAYEGHVRARVPVTFWKSPPGAPDPVLRAWVTYQACSDTACAPPVRLALVIPTLQAPLVDAFEHGVFAPDRSVFYAVVLGRGDTTVRAVDPRSGGKIRELKVVGRFDLPDETPALSVDGRVLTLKALSADSEVEISIDTATLEPVRGAP